MFTKYFRRVFCIQLLLLSGIGTASADVAMQKFEELGIPRIERYPARVTGSSNPIKSIVSLPSGEMAFLSDRKFITFNGTNWISHDELLRPTVAGTFKDETLVGSYAGLKRLVLESSGGFGFEEYSGPAGYPDSPSSLISFAMARGQLFGTHGNYLTEISPDGTVQFHPVESWTSSVFSIGEELYTTGGTPTLVNRWDWDTQSLVDCQHILEGTSYVWIKSSLPRQSGGVWLINEKNQIIGFDGKKSWFWPGNAKIDELGTSIQSVVEVGPDQLAIASLSHGALVFDESGKVVQRFSKELGLDAPGVLALGADPQNGLWLATRRSITRASLDRSTLLFDERHGLSESVLAITEFEDRMYLATASGIFASNPGADSIETLFTRVLSMEGIGSIYAYRDCLFVAGSRFICIDKEGTVTVLSENNATNLLQPKGHPNIILAGNYIGCLISRLEDGKWSRAVQVAGPSREIHALLESDGGTILGTLGGDDFARFRLEDDFAEFEILKFPVSMNGAWSVLAEVKGEIFLSSKPVHRWNEANSEFVESPEMIYYPGSPPYGFDNIFGVSAEDSWVCSNPRSGATFRRPSRRILGEIASANDALESRASSLYYDSSGNAWIGGSFGLMLARRPLEVSDLQPVVPRIHKLISLKNEERLPGVGGKDGILHLSPEQNSLRIEVSFGEFLSTRQNQLQIFIEGYDSDWPPLGQIPFREVTNLAPGLYTIVVSAHNAFGQSSLLTLPIEIEAPWFMTPLAFIFYALIALTFVVLIVFLYNRNQISKARRLQQLVTERTREIEKNRTELKQQASTLEKQNEVLAQKTEELTSATETLSATLSQLHEMQDQLVQTARTAGKAEIAINVLHNIGNVLNSLNVSLEVLTQRADNSKAIKLTRLANLLSEHRGDVSEFLCKDPRGKTVPEYLIQLSIALNEEIESTKHELGLMSEDLDHVKSIIAAQQSHARSESFFESINLYELCESALEILGDSLSRTGIEVINEIPKDLVLNNDKHRLIDILLNLVSNARDAVLDRDPEIGVISISVEKDEDGELLDIRIADNGSGIAPEVLEKLFRHGFTTKRDGHGFGLHSCANSARTLGGELNIESAGVGHGATAILTLSTDDGRGISDSQRESKVLM